MAASEFWQSAGGRPKRLVLDTLARAVERALPAAVLELPGLTSATAGKLLERLGASCESIPVRPLRGCVLAQGGRALILIDADDPKEERLMTLAHEASHLMLHYLRPRRNAVLALGPGILAVLDGARPPNEAERLAAALRDVPLARFRHALERHPRQSKHIERLEDEADHLAIELLAPYAVIRRMADRSPGSLRARFGLPAPVAANLSASVSPIAPTTKGVLHLLTPKGAGR